MDENGDLEIRESNRTLFMMQAVGARAHGDQAAERKALDAIHVLDWRRC